MESDSKRFASRNRSMAHRLMIGTIFGILVFAVFFLWGDVRSVNGIIRSIPIPFYALALAFTLLSYLIRFAKWHHFLHALRIPVNLKDSLYIFFIGLAMSITPGKVGELLKTHLIKTVSGVDKSRSAAAVFADRLTDLTAMLMLIGIGTSTLSFNYFPILGISLFLLVAIVALKSKPLCGKLIDLLTSGKLLFKFRNNLHQLYEGMYELIKLRTLLVSTLVSMAAWFMECAALFVLIKGLDQSLSLLESTLIFSLSTVAGALSMLPGGLGIAEGSMTALLMYFDAGKDVAVSVTLMIRLVTLWFGVVIGLLIFLRTWKHYQPTGE